MLFQDLDAGSYFGEMDAIDGKPRAIGVMAVTDVVIARMPRDVFRKTICRHSDAADQVLVRLTGIIRTLTNRVREFTTLDVKHRIYAELLRLSQQKSGENDVAIISPPPVHAAIAARISTRRETVAREMKALERAGPDRTQARRAGPDRHQDIAMHAQARRRLRQCRSQWRRVVNDERPARCRPLRRCSRRPATVAQLWTSRRSISRTLGSGS